MRQTKAKPGPLFKVVIVSLVGMLISNPYVALAETFQASFLWRYEGTDGCEIACYAPALDRIYVTIADGVSAIDAKTGKHVASLSAPAGYHSTSTAQSQGRLAVAWASKERTIPGRITIYDVSAASELRPKELASFPAGCLPDMVTFSPDGRWLLSANEGEPSDDYSEDPEGSITAVDLSKGIGSAKVYQLSFDVFDAERESLRSAGIRIFGPSKEHADQQATVAEDLEPEYIAVSSDSSRAWVSLQENNALAEIDLTQPQIIAIHPLGEKDFEVGTASHGGSAIGLDASDVDGGAKIRQWPIRGLFQPDAIGSLQVDGIDYLLTVNEGDPRSYESFEECCAVGELASAGMPLDKHLAGSLAIEKQELGRLEVSTASGDDDNDGDLDRLLCFGTRSFSVLREPKEGPPELVFDSGHDFEWITSRLDPDRYNADSVPYAQADQRSPKRGPEPEGLAIGRVGSVWIAAIGLERTGGVMIYDVTTPASPTFLYYLPPLDRSGKLDCAPEGLLLISAADGPQEKAVLVVCYEKSHTVTAYELSFD